MVCHMPDVSEWAFRLHVEGAAAEEPTSNMRLQVMPIFIGAAIIAYDD
jgi:hypothetical protein